MEQFGQPHFDKLKGNQDEIRKDGIYFNSNQFWHVWYDPKTGKLWNQYSRLVMEDATQYLISRGLLSEDRKQIKEFEK